MPREEPMDLLNNSSKEVVFKRKNGELIKKLAEESNFDEREATALALMHRKIRGERGHVTMSVFRDILHGGMDFTENIRHLLVDRIFSHLDKRNDLQILVDQWVTGLSLYLHGTTEEKTKFAYKVYDFMRGNKLTKEQIFPMLRGCLIRLQPEEDADETVKDMIDLLVKVIDTDRDGDVSSSEFEKVVKEKNQLFQECMGPVFPSREARHAFLSTFTDRNVDF
ncbi:hypothetical protein QAD02_011956 [Eretmocerus hayati]|uniref:Uncharacterized protein n=1 Tax=Eretmocerus hayati TaxID=131215 RepID=A0ACC2P318_9HYME|nr:hypothetical protein QAD02_011956 [Eretmocerus hayati]